MADLAVPLNAPDSLESFLQRMDVHIQSKSKFFYIDYFSFCNVILTKNTIPEAFINFCWLLITFLYDAAITCSFLPIPKPNNNENTETSNEIFMELIIQQISFVVGCIILCFALYQCVFYFNYGNPLNLSKSASNLIYWSLFFLPQLAAPTCGYLFGEMLLANFRSSFSSKSAVLYAALLFVIFFMLVLSRSAFFNIVSFNIAPKQSMFASFTTAISTTDLLVISTISIFLPFRRTRWNYLCTLSSLASFVWGIMKLFLTVRLPFYTNIATFLTTRICVDAVVFGMFGIITIWIRLDQQLVLEIWALLFFLDVILTFKFLLYWHKKTQAALTPSGSHCYSEEHILRPLTGLVYLRYGITYKMPNAVSVDFMQFLLMHRFSEEALGDIIRICLSRNIPLSEIKYIPFVLKRKHTMRMRFLAMQVEMYRRTLLDDDAQEVQDTVNKLQHEVDNLEMITDNFWTDRDTKQLSIIDLAKEVKRVTKLFTNATSEFVNSEEIQEHWKQFVDVTLCAPQKETYRPKPMFESLAHQDQNPFAFGLSEEKIQPKPKKSSRMSIENYVDRLTTSISKPFKVLAYITTILYIITLIVTNAAYYNKVSSSLNTIKKYTDMMQLTVAISHKVLKESDRLTVLPLSQEISNITGISYSEAQSFRQKISISLEAVSNASQYLVSLSGYTTPEAPDGCSNTSVSIIAHLDTKIQQYSQSNLQKRCFSQWSYAHIKEISKYMDNSLETAAPSERAQKPLLIFIPIIITSILLLLGSLIIVFVTRNKSKRMLEIVRQITAVKTQRTETKEPDFSLYAGVLIAIALLNVIGLIVYGFLFMKEYMEVDTISYTLLLQTNAVAVISRELFLMLSYAEQSMKDPEYSTIMSEENRNSQELVIEQTQFLAFAEISSYFKGIHPLNQWSSRTNTSFSTSLLDLSHMLGKSSYTNDDFYFLTARYTIYNNITSLTTSTLQQMISITKQAIQNESTSIWGWSMVFVVFLLLMGMFTGYIVSRQKLWLHGIKYILRREMSVSNTRMKRIIRLIEGDQESIIERVPQPSFIVKGDTIIACNELGARLSGQTIPQIVGQKLSEYFGEFAPIKTLTINNCVMTFKFVAKPFGDGLELVMVHDISKQARDQEKELVISELLKPNIENVPLKTEMYVIAMSFNASVERITSLFASIAELEKSYPLVKRVSISATYYKGIVICSSEDFTERTVEFVSKVLEYSQDCASAAITEGVGVVCGVVENNTIDAICGEASNRANDLMRNIPPGRCFIDLSIASKLRKPVESYFVPGLVPLVVSPLLSP